MDSAGVSGDTETCWAAGGGAGGGGGGGRHTHTNTYTLTYGRIQFTHTTDAVRGTHTELMKCETRRK